MCISFWLRSLCSGVGVGPRCPVFDLLNVIVDEDVVGRVLCLVHGDWWEYKTSIYSSVEESRFLSA